LTIDLLRWLGIDWDEGPFVQSHDLSPYVEAMRSLAQRAMTYPSDATRTQIEDSASAPQEGSTEVRFAADLRPPLERRDFDEPDRSWRFATPETVVTFDDRIAGPRQIDPSKSVGDFVIWTKRNQPAYQLAVVVDDARQGVTDVVRGDDLIDSAARQLLLYRALGLSPEPRHFHVPLVRGEDGRRLAKRHGDSRLDSYRAAGASPEQIIGLLANWCTDSGTTAPRREMSAQEFLAYFEVDTMPKRSVVFTGKDHQWLLRS
jgi:glutamyl-tRNA synthetase